jgi:hypothetical protein
VDAEHDLGAGKIQLIVTAVNVNTLGIDHRAHRAVEDADTIFFNEFAELVHKISWSKTQKTSRLKQREVFCDFLLSAYKPDFRSGFLAVFYVEQFAGNRHALIAQ